MDDAILNRINRGHTLDDFIGAVNRAAGRNFDICAHLIHGFPGESAAEFLKSADLMAGLPIDSLKLHQLHAVEGTELAEMYRRGEFTPLSLEAYIATVADFLELLPPRITIQRLYGSAPLDICVAPKWGLKNNQMWYADCQRIDKAWQLAGVPVYLKLIKSPPANQCPVEMLASTAKRLIFRVVVLGNSSSRIVNLRTLL